ncbi:MAG: hypothetical protein AAFX78_02585 [Cyanobacteria bacterium J06638_20]
MDSNSTVFTPATHCHDPRSATPFNAVFLNQMGGLRAENPHLLLDAHPTGVVVNYS